MIKINSKNYEQREVVQIAIGDQIYSLPLALYLPFKKLRLLSSIKDNDPESLEKFMNVISDYIPMDVLDELSVLNLSTIMDEWSKANIAYADKGNKEESLGN